MGFEELMELLWIRSTVRSGIYCVSQEYLTIDDTCHILPILPSILCTYTPFSSFFSIETTKKRYRAVQHQWLMAHEPRSELRCDLQTGFLWQLYKPHLRHGNGLVFSIRFRIDTMEFPWGIDSMIMESPIYIHRIP